MKVAASKSLGCEPGGEASRPKAGQAKPGLRRYHGLCPWGAKSVFFVMIWACSLPLFAQNAVTITNYLGDQSAGSFAGSVTTLNGLGAGDLVFQISTLNNGVTLSGALPGFSQSTSFVAAAGVSVPGVNLAGQTSSESTLLFQNNFYLGPNMSLNVVDLGSGLDAGITAANIFMDSRSGSGISAGAGGFLSTSGSSGQVGQAGGRAFWQAGSVTMNSIIGGNLLGGAGGAVTDVGGSNDTAGAGGSAQFQAATWVVASGAAFSLFGGAGGAVSDASGGIGGAGGGVSVSVNNWADTGSSGINLAAGGGGGGTAGGAGGAVTVNAGALTVSASNWFINDGGNGNGVGGTGLTTGGNGGAVSIHWNSLVETQGGSLGVNAGQGGTGGTTGGQGGSLAVSGVSIVEAGSASNLNLNGGTGGVGTSGTGGNGGSAAMTMTLVQLTAGTGMNLTGGNGGSSSGAGGAGGNASVSIGAIDVEGQSSLNLSAGSGGSGAAGGNGGDASVLADSVTLNTGGNLTLKGGDGGSTGGSAGGVGVGFQNTFIGSGSTLNLITGSSNGGPAGSVVASMTSLNGSGDIVITGIGSVLELGSGSFSGEISGTESLIQNSSLAAVTLSGTNSYSGGTTVGGGTLVLDSGGSLGSGGIFVQASSTLQYIDSATSNFEAVTNNGLMRFSNQSTGGNAQVLDNGVLSFGDNSNAGAGTYTITSTGQADFLEDAQGGTGRFILNSGALDISLSTAGVVTVGSIEGLGTVSLGDVGLAAGSDNLSTTFTGSISDGGNGGFLIKQGTGILAISQGSTYQGGTLIQQGQLAVGDGGALGSGSVTVLGGTLSSMGSAVAVTVGGDYIQGTNGTLQLGLYGTAATGVDSVFVVGNTQLAGTLQLTQGAGYSSLPVGQSILLIADYNDGITGNFQKIQESLAGTRLLPLYFPNSFVIESIILSFADAGNTANQKAIGADLDKVYLSPDLALLILGLGAGPGSDPVSLRTAFDQISPSSFSVIYQSAFEDASIQASEIEDRLAQLRDTQALPAAPSAGRRASLDKDARFAGNLSVADEMAMIVRPKTLNDDGGGWGGFFSGDGGHFIVGNSLNAPGFKSTSYGLPAAGVDYQISRQLALGVMVGYGESDIALNANGAITQTGAQVGFYGTWHPTKAYLDVLVSGGLNQYSSQRQTYDGFVGGKTQGYEINSRVTGGYDWKGRDWTLGPSLAAQWTHVSLGGFTEKGPIDSLTMPDQAQDSIMSLVGFHAQGKIHIGGVAFEPQAKASWEHEFAYQGGTIQAGFGEGDNFEVEGPAVGQDGFLVRGGLDTILSPQFTISLGAQAELGRSNLTSNQFDGGMKFGF